MSGSDQTGPERAKPASVGARTGARRPRRGQQPVRSAGKRRLWVLVAVAAVVLVAVLLGPSLLKMIKPATDFTGEGKSDIIVQVHPGDSG